MEEQKVIQTEGGQVPLRTKRCFSSPSWPKYSISALCGFPRETYKAASGLISKANVITSHNQLRY